MSNCKDAKKIRHINRRLLVFILSITVVFAVAFGLAACGSSKKTNNSPFVNKYPAMTQVGYYGKITKSNVKRTLPTVNSGKGLNSVAGTDYPLYGTNYAGGDKDGIIAESSFLTATGTANAGGGGYTWMDEHGNLYAGTRAEPDTTGRKLYKHAAAVGNYRGDVSDSEPAVEKVVTMRARGYNGYSVTGIYAPAGEVITIKISQEDMEATGGITIHIGQALYNGQANNIWSGKGMPRMPHLLNTMQVNQTPPYSAKTVCIPRMSDHFSADRYISAIPTRRSPPQFPAVWNISTLFWVIPPKRSLTD